MSQFPSNSASSGLAPNVAGALAYVLGPITGVFFLVTEKENAFIRFHAAQSIVVSIAIVAVSIGLSILTAVLGFIPILGWLIGLTFSMAVGFGSFVLWLLLMYRAYQGQEWEVPLVGRHSRKALAPRLGSER
jgi:uncharacterized membrane protein